MPVPTSPQDLIDLIREKLFNNTSGLIEEPDLREVLENIVKVLDAKFSMFSPNLTEEQFAKWNLILDYMAKETKGVLTTSSTAPTEKGKYLLSGAGTYTNLGGLVTTADKLNYAYFDGTTWKLIAVDMPITNYNENELNPTSTNIAETGSTVFSFLKKEINTINLFNKKTFKSGFAFSTADGSVIPMNSSNGISDLIPVQPNSIYGLIFIGNDNNAITEKYIVEYDENKEYLGFQNLGVNGTFQTNNETHFVRYNPNSSNGFDKLIDGIVITKSNEFPFGYLEYGEIGQKYQGDLSFYKKQDFISSQSDSTNNVSINNNILTIPSGQRSFHSKQIFSFLFGIEYTGKARICIKITCENKEFLGLILSNSNVLFSNKSSKSLNTVYYDGQNKNEYFVIADGEFNINDGILFYKNSGINYFLENEISAKIDLYILYLDENGKPRNIEDATLQPNYIQANSGFNFASLNSVMNGKFISIIQDIDLQGATIDFVAQGVKNLKLVFNGGRILNGKIRSNYTRCIFNSNEAFVNVEILNQFQNEYAIPEWFGAKIDGQDGGIGDFTKDDSFAMNQALKFSSLVKLTGSRTMIIKKPIVLRSGNTIEADKNFEIKLGDASNCTLLKNENVDIPHDGINPVVYPQGFKRNRNITIRGGIWNGNGLKQNRANNSAVGDQNDVIGTPHFTDADTQMYYGCLAKFADIDNILFEKATVRNPRTYGFALGGLTNYVFRDIIFERDYHIENGDNIHLHGHCYNGIIENLSGQSGDDFVAVTTSEAQRLSMRVGDVIGLKVRNIYSYGLNNGASPSNPSNFTNGIPPKTRTMRCVRLSYTDHVIDEVFIENLRGLNTTFMSEVTMAYLHLPDFNGTNGYIGSISIKGIKNNDGCTPISVGANTIVKNISLSDVYYEIENANEIPALVRPADNFGGQDQWALTEVGTVVIDNVYFLKGNTFYASADGLVLMLGKLKNLFINNLIVETKSGSSKINALFSGRIDNVSITNSNIDVTEINSTNGNATTNLTFRESNNEFNSAVMGVMPKRVITESIVLSSNPTNPKMGDKILKSDGIYLYTTSWNKL